jgi:hypothetical protein
MELDGERRQLVSRRVLAPQLQPAEQVQLELPVHAVLQPEVQEFMMQFEEPVQLSSQPPPLQSTITLPVPLELSLQLPPGQSRVTLPVALLVAVQLPPGQSRMQLPIPAQENSQPPPSQVWLQLPMPSHAHGVPALHDPALLPMKPSKPQATRPSNRPATVAASVDPEMRGSMIFGRTRARSLQAGQRERVRARRITTA